MYFHQGLPHVRSHPHPGAGAARVYLSTRWDWHSPFFMIVGVGMLGGLVQLCGGVAAVVAGHIVSTGADGKLQGFDNALI